MNGALLVLKRGSVEMVATDGHRLRLAARDLNVGAFKSVEVHDRPSRALSDGANALNLRKVKPLPAKLRDLAKFIRKFN